MTKSTHQILYVILFLLLAVLYLLHFSNSNNAENITAVEKQETIQPLNEGSLNIAFVNSDTVSKYYEFAKKIQKTLTTKRSEAEGQIKSKYFAYESLVQEFEKASGVNINYEIVDRRPGDIDQCYADTSLANNILNWKAELDIQKMCEDTWRWQSMNPKGYDE